MFFISAPLQNPSANNEARSSTNDSAYSSKECLFFVSGYNISPISLLWTQYKGGNIKASRGHNRKFRRLLLCVIEAAHGGHSLPRRSAEAVKSRRWKKLDDGVSKHENI